MASAAISVASQSVAGGCLCGAVRYTAVPANDDMGVCHCDKCRKWSGGSFMVVSCTDVKVGNEAALGIYRSSDWAERVFCKTCGSSLFWRFHDGDAPVAVAMPSFDDISMFNFAEEIFIDEKPALYAFAGERQRKTGAEVIAEFAAKQAG